MLQVSPPSLVVPAPGGGRRRRGWLSGIGGRRRGCLRARAALHGHRRLRGTNDGKLARQYAPKKKTKKKKKSKEKNKGDSKNNNNKKKKKKKIRRRRRKGRINDDTKQSTHRYGPCTLRAAAGRRVCAAVGFQQVRHAGGGPLTF